MELPPINIHTSPIRPVHEPVPDIHGRPRFHRDVAIVGTELDDYTLRTPDENGLFVHIVQHKEWIEEIPQPPTPEQIAQKKSDEKARFKAVALAVGAAFAVLGTLVYIDNKRQQIGVETTTPAVEQ